MSYERSAYAFLVENGDTGYRKWRNLSKSGSRPFSYFAAAPIFLHALLTCAKTISKIKSFAAQPISDSCYCLTHSRSLGCVEYGDLKRPHFPKVNEHFATADFEILLRAKKATKRRAAEETMGRNLLLREKTGRSLPADGEKFLKFTSSGIQMRWRLLERESFHSYGRGSEIFWDMGDSKSLNPIFKDISLVDQNPSIAKGESVEYLMSPHREYLCKREIGFQIGKRDVSQLSRIDWFGWSHRRLSRYVNRANPQAGGKIVLISQWEQFLDVTLHFSSFGHEYRDD